ncbi:hypothetical protein GQ44DRAFT_706428 [Phaeosphaeriaceae sp. PMI808]|nr:hypothetical protein GQ44DRAFT_706428 [Phaeosphaeriaceae sp. PMI808]
MSGLLYWVCFVGVAAARTSTSRAVCAIRARRHHIMAATRALVSLIFHHPIPILKAQKRLLRVQELIGPLFFYVLEGSGHDVPNSEFLRTTE